MMITRVVKMHFKPDSKSAFIEQFYASRERILGFDGCETVELFEDLNNLYQLYTLSKWRSINDLENYRGSDFFKETWANVKPLFNQKAEAWSLNSCTP